MTETIQERELFVLDGSDVLIRGTYHKTHDDDSAVRPNVIEGDRIGVVFLNSTSPTRAANGDAAVHLAESFAESGYPAFRLDLPGFGDSEGDHAEDLVGFISRGGYASIASSKVRELVARFNLSGVVILGHCAGSVSALYTAASSKECKGLVLIGPFFHLTQPIGPTKVRRKLKLWALHSRLGRFVSSIFESLNEIRLPLRATGLPKNANRPLVRCLKKVAPAGLPILILTGPDRRTSGMKPKDREFDYLKYLLRGAGHGNQVVVKVTEGANHAFANRKGRAAVRQHTQQWLNAFFPRIKHEEDIVGTLGSDREQSRGHSLHESYLHK